MITLPKFFVFGSEQKKFLTLHRLHIVLHNEMHDAAIDVTDCHIPPAKRSVCQQTLRSESCAKQYASDGKYEIKFPFFLTTSTFHHPSTCSTMQGKHDLHPSYFGLCQLILLFALIHGGKPNARGNWIFFIPIFTLYVYSVFFCASASRASDYTLIASQLQLIPTASDYILLRNRQFELRQIGQKKSTSEMTFTERFTWALSLLATTRGIGWAHEPTTHMPARPTASRAKFIASQFLWIIFTTSFLTSSAFIFKKIPV